VTCLEPGVGGSSKGSGKQDTINLMSPQGGQDWKRQRQKSPGYQERQSDEEVRGTKKNSPMGLGKRRLTPLGHS
ncbi:hypothetical protein PAXRUDRAFT_137531, partial [Paxillus rubicundulus Ve08.2h10]